MKSSNRLVALSQDFLYAARTGNATLTFVEQLADLDLAQLRASLETDAEKKAFWINLYNAYTQALLRQNPEQYKRRSRFFGNRQLRIAGRNFSLDDIEHGLLRRSRIKWSLGYLGKPFPSSTEKALRVDTLDYRLHFALNCGAKSCPPIAFYTPELLDQQLELATRAYLASEAEWKAEENQLALPAIMSWFRRDFGGKKGMRALLRKQGFSGVNASTAIRFKPYDWSLYLDTVENR